MKPSINANLTRRELLVMGAGFGLITACRAQGTLMPPSASSEIESARTVDGVEKRLKRVLDAYVKEYCAEAPYVTAALYANGHSFLRGYAMGVKSDQIDTSWIFGIGSNTKVFTATMLAYECGGSNPSKKLTDPVAMYLPSRVAKHGHAIKEVTLVDLATHTSSFPDSVSAEDKNTLFFDLPPSVAQVGWWTSWTNTGSPSDHDLCVGKEPGTCYNYSDWGFITLGFAVSNSNETPGKKYTDILKQYVTKPLELNDTGAHKPLSVPGHLANGKVAPKPPTDLRSNAPDLLRFLQAQLGVLEGVSPELQAAIDLTQEVHWRGAKYGNPHTDVGLAWQLPVMPGKPKLIWKNGEAGGFTSFMGMIPSKSLAVAILTNSEAANPTKSGIQFLLDIGG